MYAPTTLPAKEKCHFQTGLVFHMSAACKTSSYYLSLRSEHTPTQGPVSYAIEEDS